jgi:hypothetical protein
MSHQGPAPQITERSKVKGYKKAFQRKNIISILLFTEVFFPQNWGLISDPPIFATPVTLIVTDFSR